MKQSRGFYDVFVRTCAKYASKVAVTVYEDNHYKSYTYSELYGVCEYVAQHLQQLNCNRGIIGLVSRTNFIIPSMVAAAHKSCTSFMFLDPTKEYDSILEEIKFTIVMSIMKDQENIQNSLCKPPDRCLSVLGMCICIYDYGYLGSPSTTEFPLEYSFIAMTSGTTGEPKKIRVPVQSIQPNVTDLTSMFHVTPDDVIYFSTPLTFDPSMIELLLANMNGASLLIAPPITEVLFSNNKQHSVTIWQTTPSKFFQFSNAQIKNKILSKNSTLKILALGGEPFSGAKRLKELKHNENKTRIFTLYGVTEMSCWACVAELDLAKMSEKELPLGKCLSETKIILEPTEPTKKTSGQIVLVSNTRNCVVLHKKNQKSELNSLKFVKTGDYAEVSKCGNMYYRGRKDDIIKRFGHKINLQFIESTLMHCPRVKACSCVWLPKPRLLIVYFSSETFSSQDLSDFLKCKLDDKHWPDRIVRVDNMPMTAHGKVSKLMLTKTIENEAPVNRPFSLQALKLKFLEEIKNSLAKNVTYDYIKNKNFFSIGGTSFLAILMCNNISFSYPEFGKCLLPALLNQSYTIDEVFNIVNKQMIESADAEINTKEKKKVNTKRVASESNEASLSSKVSRSMNIPSVEFIEMWTYNTGKCVDASPSVLQTGLNLYVAVGSHSGQIVVVDAMTAIIVGVIEVNSRIEAAVYCYPGDDTIPPCGIVGAYDGTIVCFTIETCKQIWKINIGAMIKSKATYSDGCVYVAAYDGHIRCINIVNGEILSTVMIMPNQAISADLVTAKSEYIMVGSLSGVICGIHTVNNMVAWRSVLDSPVFASPALYDEEKYVIFAEVYGEIHCRTVQKGLKIWTFSGTKGNIFSSIAIKQVSKLKHQMVFGCHDNYVYSLTVKNFQPSLDWKTYQTAPVYSTPCFLNENMILATSNDGRMTILNSESGDLAAEYTLPGKTFSSPAVYGDYIFIGCRNDLVYSLKYVINL